MPTPEKLAAGARDWKRVQVEERGQLKERLLFTCLVLWYEVCGSRAVRLVISRDPAGPEEDDFFFTTDISLQPEAVVGTTAGRWCIEVATKGLKQRLGLGQYQCRYYEGMVHHLHLSLLAHLILTAAELQRRGPKACKDSATLELPSVGVLQTRLQQELWRSLAQRLRLTCADKELLDRIDRALGAA